jgi:hypothetical protein
MIRWQQHGDIWEAHRKHICVGFVRESGAKHFIAVTTQISNREPKVFDSLEDAKEWIEWAAKPFWLRSWV